MGWDGAKYVHYYVVLLPVYKGSFPYISLLLGGGERKYYPLLYQGVREERIPLYIFCS